MIKLVIRNTFLLILIRVFKMECLICRPSHYCLKVTANSTNPDRPSSQMKVVRKVLANSKSDHTDQFSSQSRLSLPTFTVCISLITQTNLAANQDCLFQHVLSALPQNTTDTVSSVKD